MKGTHGKCHLSLHPSPIGSRADAYKCPCMQLNGEMCLNLQLLVLFVPLDSGTARTQAVRHFDFMTGEGSGW